MSLLKYVLGDDQSTVPFRTSLIALFDFDVWAGSGMHRTAIFGVSMVPLAFRSSNERGELYCDQ